jgi:hypothetical protein
MRIRLVAAVVVVVIAGGAAVAVAAHPQIDPATVPVGFLTAHSQINNVPAAAIEKALASGKTDVFIEHGRLGANASVASQTTPGPVFFVVQKGQLRFEQSTRGQCRRKAYASNQGIAIAGGKAHRFTAGPAGADYYAVYLLPRKTGPNFKRAPTPAGC